MKGQHSVQTGDARSGAKRGKALVVALVIVIIAIVAVVFLSRSCADTHGDVKQGEEIEVVIPAGATTDEIGKILAQEGVISSSKQFVERVTDLNQAASLQSGSYILIGGDELDDIIKVLSSGQTGRQLVIPEGYTIKQIAERVEKACGIPASEFIECAHHASSYASEYTFLQGVYDDSMEGFLYPDTYRVDAGATVDDVIRMMLDQFAAQIKTVDLSYAESKGLTLYDVVTLASMVEKEYEDESDKAQIAAVFYNRLHAGMTLGSDVTTYYAVGKDMTEELTASDLASDSPYNTRNPNNYGLPAGPICNPSVSTIEAAAHPAEVDYLYFFFSNSEGKTMFFANDADFNAAWAQYGD